MLFLFIIRYFCLQQTEETKETINIQSLQYLLTVNRKDYYNGHLGENYDFIRSIEPIDGGFQVVFRADENQISVSPQDNVVIVKVRMGSKHFVKESEYILTVSNGQLYDVSLDEIIRGTTKHSVLGLRVKEVSTEEYG